MGAIRVPGVVLATPRGPEPSNLAAEVPYPVARATRVGGSLSPAVDGFRPGEREALARMYRSYQPLVSRYLGALVRRRRNLGAGQRAVVEDLVQEVFLRAFSAASRVGYDGVRDLSPFLLTVAKNCFRDLCRRQGREEPWEQEKLQAQSCVVSPPTESPDPTSNSVASEAAVLLVLSTYVHALPEELRRVYDRRFAMGESQESAAEALGLSRTRLRTREKRILTGLRIALRSAGIELSSSPSRRPGKSTNAPPRRRK